MTSFLFFLFSFFDPCSGLQLEVPDRFEPMAECVYDDHCWYSYEDGEGNELSIEIEENDCKKTHAEHFHQALINGADEKEEMTCTGLKFECFCVGPLEISKCQLRILAIAEMYRHPLYFCDYLFVKDHYSFTISLTKVDDGKEDGLLPMLESISFNP
ncbi:MAG: hypothetical protein P0S96_00655 [Simkaniaceae bacterium]|nr:hypothetical protein [Candidatus Sacchlamyda saccharinae]